MRELLFVTGNENKFREAQAILGLKLARSDIEVQEMQDLNVRAVAESKVRDAFDKLGTPLFVEDAGLEIAALNRFPGALQSWVSKTIGNQGILKLLQGSDDRRAKAIACIAYHDGTRVRVFEGVTEGTISAEVKKGSGWDYDFIFIPDGDSRTFSEMSPEEKDKVSHRFKALSKFAEWLRNPK